MYFSIVIMSFGQTIFDQQSLTVTCPPLPPSDRFDLKMIFICQRYASSLLPLLLSLTPTHLRAHSLSLTLTHLRAHSHSLILSLSHVVPFF